MSENTEIYVAKQNPCPDVLFLRRPAPPSASLLVPSSVDSPLHSRESLSYAEHATLALLLSRSDPNLHPIVNRASKGGIHEQQSLAAGPAGGLYAVQSLAISSVKPGKSERKEIARKRGKVSIQCDVRVAAEQIRTNVVRVEFWKPVTKRWRRW